MEDPTVVSIVIVDAPSDPDASGGKTAGPTSSIVLKQALENLGIEPDYQQIFASEEEPQTQSEESEVVYVTMPELVGENVEVAAATLIQMGLEPEYIEEGNIVTYQVPATGTQVEQGAVVQLTLTHIDAFEKKVIVPDLKGLRVYQAMDKLIQENLTISVMGEGIVMEQEPLAGTLAPKGSIVTVIFGKD
jgi:stage V sporulation protein D (sporulation-specific penicillin-binding protein)